MQRKWKCIDRLIKDIFGGEKTFSARKCYRVIFKMAIQKEDTNYKMFAGSNILLMNTSLSIYSCGPHLRNFNFSSSFMNCWLEIGNVGCCQFSLKFPLYFITQKAQKVDLFLVAYWKLDWWGQQYPLPFPSLSRHIQRSILKISFYCFCFLTNMKFNCDHNLIFG